MIQKEYKSDKSIPHIFPKIQICLVTLELSGLHFTASILPVRLDELHP